MKKLLLGFAIGYVLGTKAGRERYEQIVQLYHKFVDHPVVQNATETVWARIDEWITISPETIPKFDESEPT